MLQKNKPIFLIKLGGSLITDKQKLNSFNARSIRNCFSKLASFYQPENHGLIIGNGAGANTHYLAKKYQTLQGITDSQTTIGHCLVKESALRHHSWLNQIGVLKGLPLFSFSPSSFLLSEKGSIKKSFFSALLYCLEKKIVPHLYGDVIFDKKTGLTIYSTEKIFIWLCQNLQEKGFKQLIVYFLGDTNGVLDENKKTIKVLKSTDLTKYKLVIGQSAGFDVTGGMLQKVKAGLYLAKLGCRVYIGNGNSFLPDNLKSPQKSQNLTEIVA